VKDYPYWWDTLRESPVASHQSSVGSHQSAVEREQPANARRVDVVVIGAGYTGLAAARHLARSGASVLVLERDRVGAGASSRNGGQVVTGLKLDPGTLVQRFGEVKARRLFEIAAESMARLEAIVAEERIDCDYRRTGHIQAASKPKHFKAFQDEQALLARAFHHRVELVPRAEQRSEIGSDAYHGLLLDEHSGALNPAKYVEGLAAAATRSGATIMTHMAVKGLEKIAGGWRVGAARDVEARDVLVATNGYTTDVTPELHRRLIPIGSFIIATEPIAAKTAAALLPKGRVAFDSMNFLHYYRMMPDRRLLFGGRAEFRTPDEHTAGRVAGILRADMVHTFPELRDTRVDYSWGGNVAFSRDQMPRAGRRDDLYYSGAYCGHGIAMATYLGEQIARRIAGESFEHPLFDDHFARIPLYRGTPWFLPLAAAYYRVKDWLQ
jgi:glycine/D-amino acid oxidase-like deaminating enzyme